MKNETKYIGVFHWRGGGEYAVMSATEPKKDAPASLVRKGKCPGAFYDTPREALEALSKSIDRAHLRGQVHNIRVEEVEAPAPGLEVGDTISGRVGLRRGPFDGAALYDTGDPNREGIRICPTGLYEAMGIHAKNLPEDGYVTFRLEATVEEIEY